MQLVLALLLTSATFASGTVVPRTMVAHECGGANVSPALAWRAVPPGTRSFALIVHDPDAPTPGGFYHWVVYDIPASTRGLSPRTLPPGRSGRNGTGSVGYFGPCPPPGKVHHYHVTLYALDVRAIATAHPMTATELLARLRGHVLARASVIGLWRATGRP
ncbi:MAG TPA: YbhB/YbcL family Raf kinase inhibitor-like protein [Candidatus Aquilonibacter sp.]